MLPRISRLSRKQDVERVSRRGRPVFGTFATVRALPNGQPVVRCTVVAGLKVSKRAVQRNRAKRLLREALHDRIRILAPGYDIVVHANARIIGQPLTAVRADLHRALSRARVMKQDVGTRV